MGHFLWVLTFKLFRSIVDHRVVEAGGNFCVNRSEGLLQLLIHAADDIHGHVSAMELIKLLNSACKGRARRSC